MARALPRDGRMAKSRKREGNVGVVDREQQDTVVPQSVGDTTTGNVDRDRVAARAYELYLRRGGGDGRDLDDWLEAERELSGDRDVADRNQDSGA